VDKFRLCLVRIFLVSLESFRRALSIVEDRSLLGGEIDMVLVFHTEVDGSCGGVVSSGLVDRGVTILHFLLSFQPPSR